MNRLGVVAAAVAVAVLVVVGGWILLGQLNARPSGSPAPTSSPSDQAGASVTAQPTPTAPVATSPTGSGSPGPGTSPGVSPSPGPTDPFPADSVARVAVDELIVRTRAGTASNSVRLPRRLTKGDQVVVLDGPRSANGYRWYRVLPLSADPAGRARRAGWVAVASRTGEPWLTPVKASCPSLPAKYADLQKLGQTQGLACFGDQQLTFDAFVIPCNCDIDGGRGGTPPWLITTYPGGSASYLIDPGAAPKPPDPSKPTTAWIVHAHPAAIVPAPIPAATAVRVTGQFDHPEADMCKAQITETEKSVDPAEVVQTCRTTFAITGIELIP